MKRIQLSVIVGTTLLLAGLQAAANAQQPGGVAYGPAPQRAPVNMALYPIPYQPGHHGLRSHQYTHYDHIPQQPGSYTHTPQRPHYPYLNAPLYASPQPNIPHQVGGTVVSNQAFAPHEMLYPHTYRAMYGPFSYRVQGDWVVTPLGVWSTEHWKLQGTEVSVKYKSRISFLKGFFPPSGSMRLR
ncbi:MAG: hypothetical protein HON53_19895 [Planctomycetaceae bacterium]|jgi:hypothetical protein|nr:hypothetical protein [Planctomycetaceae bacterium]MBT6155871.1 hypothetical protein [Planctomycetaceae bacterium]MBT6484257.1 hypothetical protein [Planctomycetaceae bacterium]